MPKVIQENVVFFAMLSLYLLIDLIALWYGNLNHQELSPLACALFPITRPAQLFLPQNLIILAQEQCPYGVTKVGAGISFLLLKILITEIFAIGFYLRFWFQNCEKNIKKFEMDVPKYGGAAVYLLMLSCFFLLLFTYCFTRFQYLASNPSHFRSDLVFKLNENFFCAMGFFIFSGVLSVVTFGAVSLYRFLLKRN